MQMTHHMTVVMRKGTGTYLGWVAVGVMVLLVLLVVLSTILLQYVPLISSVLFGQLLTQFTPLINNPLLQFTH